MFSIDAIVALLTLTDQQVVKITDVADNTFVLTNQNVNLGRCSCCGDTGEEVNQVKWEVIDCSGDLPVLVASGLELPATNVSYPNLNQG